MRRAEAIAALKQIHNQLTDIIQELEMDQAPAAPVDPDICPVHKVKWIDTHYGLAHPPTKEGEKWCNKAALEKKIAEGKIVI